MSVLEITATIDAPEIALAPISPSPAITVDNARWEYQRRQALGRIRRARTLAFLVAAKQDYFVARGPIDTVTEEDAEAAIAHLAFMPMNDAIENDHGAISETLLGGAATVELLNRTALRVQARRSEFEARHGS